MEVLLSNAWGYFVSILAFVLFWGVGLLILGIGTALFSWLIFISLGISIYDHFPERVPAWLAGVAGGAFSSFFYMLYLSLWVAYFRWWQINAGRGDADIFSKLLFINMGLGFVGLILYAFWKEPN